MAVSWLMAFTFAKSTLCQRVTHTWLVYYTVGKTIYKNLLINMCYNVLGVEGDAEISISHFLPTNGYYAHC